MQHSLLIAASCPPPLAGQTIATAMLLRALKSNGVPHKVVDLSREFHTGNRITGYAKRAMRLASLPTEILKKSTEFFPGQLIFYLQLGHSVQTILRDVPLLAAAQKSGATCVVHVHGSGFRQAFDNAPLPLRTAMKAALRNVRRAIVLSDSLKPMFHGLVPSDCIVSIPNGVETELAQDAALWTPVTPKNEFTGLYMSNLIEFKGYREVLEAARLASEHGKPYKFRLCGSKTESTSIDPDTFIREHRLTNVIYSGVVTGTEKHQAFREAQAFLLPSTYEGQPIAILEALHYGLPVITTNAGGIGDIVHDQTNGLVIEQSAVAIMEAMDTLYNSPKLRKKMSQNNRKVARDMYTEAAHGDALIALFKTVAGELIAHQ